VNSNSVLCQRGPACAWALVVSVALLVSACGGGGGSDSVDTTPPPPAPGPGAAAFKLVPERLGLSVGDDAALMVLQPSSTLLWSSSNPAVASVDSAGHVTALTKGSAVISATSGTAVSSSAIKVYASTDATHSALIAVALAQNRISAEQALMYRVFARFGDERLPAEFDGAPTSGADHMLMREVSGKLPTLSQAAQDALLPFLLPPIYAQSWYAQQLGRAPRAAAAAVRWPPTAAGRERPQALTVNCEATLNPDGWLKRSTAHFNIYYVDLERFGIQTEKIKSQLIADVVEEVYLSMTGLLQRFPISDLDKACNGGDGAVDIYLHAGQPMKELGSVTTYPGSCQNAPSYMSLNTQHFVFVGAADRPAAEARRIVKGVLAHEITHVLQFTMDRKAACSDYEWFDEATAEWAMDHIDPGFDKFEDGINKLSTTHSRTGEFLLAYLGKNHMASMEKPGSDESAVEHGYAEYLFFQYLARKYAPGTIKQIFDATTGNASVEAIEAVLAARGGMKAVWPEFAQTLWNGRADQVLDYWSKEDHYDYGLANIFAPSTGDRFAASLGHLKSLEIDQKGQPRATFKLLDNALQLPGEFPHDNYEIQPRAMFYEHLKFSDASVHSVYFLNPIAILPNRDFMKVQAVKKIAGTWKPVEDWTQESTKSLCRDKADERVEELLIIVSNSEVNRGTERPFSIPKGFSMRVSTSNVGCWKWKGTASTEKTYDDPGESGVATGSAVVEFALASAAIPGRAVFDTRSGFVDGLQTGRLGACDIKLVGDRRLVVPADGTLDLDLDLDLGFGEAPDRNLITLSGESSLTTTTTLTCPAGTTTSTGALGWTWLQVDDEVVYKVSADGQSIEGSFIKSFPLTRSTITTRFKFSAVRE